MADPTFLPYGRQTIEDDDIAAVVAALKDDFLTTGPRVEAFEAAFAEAVGARCAIACSNGTAALHLAMAGLGAGPGDAVIVPAITFVATANAARFCGAEVVFADVDAETGLMTPDTLERAIGELGGRRLAAVAPVHLRGEVAELPALAALAGAAGAPLVEDACHALGSRMTFAGEAERVGDARHAAAACFSFHPVKTIATGEGGMAATNDPALARRLKALRSHGVVREAADFVSPGLSLGEDGAALPWAYEMQALGFNYRLPDILCALGLRQLTKLGRFADRRRALAARYRALLAPLAPLVRSAASPAWSDAAPHLFVALVEFKAAGVPREAVMAAMAARGIGTQVHYIPVHRQPYYQRRYGDIALPGAEAWYARALSLPLFPAMTDDDPARVVEALAAALGLQ